MKEKKITVYQLARWRDGSATCTGKFEYTREQLIRSQENSLDCIYTTVEPMPEDMDRNGKIKNTSRFIEFAKPV